MPTRAGLPLCLAGLDFSVPAKGSWRSPPGPLTKLGKTQPEYTGPTLQSPAVEAAGTSPTPSSSGSKKRRNRRGRPPSPSPPAASTAEANPGRGPKGGRAATDLAGEEAGGPTVQSNEEVTGGNAERQSGSGPCLGPLSRDLPAPPLPGPRSDPPEEEASSQLAASQRESDATTESVDSDGEEAAAGSPADGGTASPLQRHRQALTQEMARLDRLRSALREREHPSDPLAPTLLWPPNAPPRTDPGHGPSSRGDAASPWEGQGPLPPHSSRALDIIRAGIASTAPAKWDAKWQAWAAKAA